MFGFRIFRAQFVQNTPEKIKPCQPIYSYIVRLLFALDYACSFPLFRPLFPKQFSFLKYCLWTDWELLVNVLEIKKKIIQNNIIIHACRTLFFNVKCSKLLSYSIIHNISSIWIPFLIQPDIWQIGSNSCHCLYLLL